MEIFGESAGLGGESSALWRICGSFDQRERIDSRNGNSRQQRDVCARSFSNEEVLQLTMSPRRKEPRGRWSLTSPLGSLSEALYRCISLCTSKLAIWGTQDEVSGAVADPPHDGSSCARRCCLQGRRYHARFYPRRAIRLARCQDTRTQRDDLVSGRSRGARGSAMDRAARLPVL